MIENTQRDANIAMMNEFALIFHRLGIDTQDVLAVAHDQFKTLGIEGLRRLANDRAIIYDIKGLFPKNQVDGRL